jgi:hypothetical protein
VIVIQFVDEEMRSWISFKGGMNHDKIWTTYQLSERSEHYLYILCISPTVALMTFHWNIVYGLYG